MINDIKKICFDIDGVICTISKDYALAKPIKKNIHFINELYNKKYYIVLFTARFMGRNNDNKTLAIKNAKKLTINQLNKWNIKYNKLIFGKPSYDILIDDKALFFKKNWISSLKSKL